MCKLILVLILVALAFEQSNATCGVCNANSGVACVSKNEFQICVGGKPLMTQNFTCPNVDEACTQLGLVCTPLRAGSTVKPACGDETNCGICAGKTDQQFTCTSRSTFTKCTGGKLSEERGVCPVGFVCDASESIFPCVQSCSVTSLCERDTAIDAPIIGPTSAPSLPPTALPTLTQPATQTPTDPSTLSTKPPTDLPTQTTTELSTQPPTQSATEAPTPTPVTPMSVCISENKAIGRFPYPSEAECATYVNCYMKNNEYVAAVLNCPTLRYFNKEIQSCEIIKPSWCNQIVENINF